MTIDSQSAQAGISIHASAPVLLGGTELDDLTPIYSDYGHTENAEIGFDTAKITIDAERDYIEEWFENGLERDITVYNEGGQIAWQGWANQLDVSFGALSLSTGPILNIFNQAETRYTPLDTSVNPPIKGTSRKTAATYVIPSQDRYGVWHKVLSAGEIEDALAEQFQATQLAENAWPESSPGSLSLGGTPSTPRLVINCLGYGHWFQAYPVAETTDTFRTVTAQIQAVRGLSPNAIFSTDNTNMQANGLLVPSLEVSDKMALEYIKSLVALGDANDDRWIFGVYEDRKLYYNVVPTTILYNFRLSGQAQELILESNQGAVNPWDVHPAQWVQTIDLLIGRTGESTNLRDDNRNMFIETVEYTAPFGLRLNGKKVSTAPQMLAKMGAGQL